MILRPWKVACNFAEFSTWLLFIIFLKLDQSVLTVGIFSSDSGLRTKQRKSERTFQ